MTGINSLEVYTGCCSPKELPRGLNRQVKKYSGKEVLGYEITKDW